MEITLIIRTKIAIIAIVLVDHLSSDFLAPLCDMTLRLHRSLCRAAQPCSGGPPARHGLCSIRCSLYDNILCQFVTTIIIAVYMQIIIYNSRIKVCNQFIQWHKISLQQIRTTQQPAHQLFDLFVLSAILHASKTEQYGAAKHLLLMGRSLLTGDVLVMVRSGLGRFRHRRGPFWSTLWAVLVFCCVISSTVGRFGDGPFWYRPIKNAFSRKNVLLIL